MCFVGRLEPERAVGDARRHLQRRQACAACPAQLLPPRRAFLFRLPSYGSLQHVNTSNTTTPNATQAARFSFNVVFSVFRT